MKRIIFYDSSENETATEEEKREAFYMLGVISTGFVDLEQKVQDLFIGFMNFETPVGMHFIEYNSLETNIQLIAK